MDRFVSVRDASCGTVFLSSHDQTRQAGAELHHDHFFFVVDSAAGGDDHGIPDEVRAHADHLPARLRAFVLVSLLADVVHLPVLFDSVQQSRCPTSCGAAEAEDQGQVDGSRSSPSSRPRYRVH